MGNDLVIYDVCNDYTLEPAPDVTWPSNEYRTVKTQMGFVYVHKLYNEIHYLIGKPGLTGQRLDITDNEVTEDAD